MSEFLKKAFVSLTVVATIVWSVGLASFVPTAQAASSGDLIKASGAAVYYYGADGKRYVFPDEKTYNTWYSDFSGVMTITDAELAAIPIGGNVTYRPGVKLVKITTDPKVYAVGSDGTLRWVTSESIASALYGADWATMVQDVPDPFFVNYTVGSDIDDVADYDPAAATAAATSINADKGLGTAGTGGALTISLASDNPVGQSVPAGATPATNVVFAKINLTTGSNAVMLNKVTITRSGLSADTDLSAVKVWNGSTQLDTSQTLNSAHQATFNTNLNLAANTTTVLTVTGDLAANVGNNSSEIRLGIAANSDINSNASSVTGAPVYGNTMTATQVSVGSLSIAQGATMPSDANGASPWDADVDLGETETFFAARLVAGSVEDVRVNSITFESGDNSTINVGDVEDLMLINDTTGETIATLDSLNADGDAIFDLSANPLVIAKGNTRDLVLRGTVVDGAARVIAFDIHDGTSYLIMATGATYGFGVAYTNGGGWSGNQGIGNGIDINQGTVTVSKAASAPAAGNIPIGGTDINIGEFSFEIQGEDVRFGSSEVDIAVNDAVADGDNCVDNIDNVKLVDASTGEVLGGPVSPTGTMAGGTCTAAFSSSFELPNGTNTVRVTVNTTSAIDATDTLTASFDMSQFANVKGLTSNRTITPNPVADVAANVQTVKGATLVAQMGATPVAGNVVAGKTSFTVAYVGLDASSGGEDIRVASLALRNDGTADNGDYVNARLINVATGAQVGQTVQPSNNTVSFTFSGDELVVTRTEQVNLALQIDVLSTITALETFCFSDTTDAAGNCNEAGGPVVTGTGKSSATAATVTASGISPTQTAQNSGSLKVTLDADTALSTQLVASSTGNSVVSYKFEAVDEDIDVTDIYIVGARSSDGTAVATNWGNNVMSLEVYVDGVKVGSTLSSATNGIQLLSLPAGTFVVPKDEDRILSIRANLHNKTNVVTTDANAEFFQVGIANDVAAGAGFGTTWQSEAGAAADGYLITATGQDSGTALATNTINSTGAAGGLIYGGNVMSAHDGVLTVTLNASSPSGLKVAATNQELIRINLTATNDDITVNVLGLRVTNTCNLTTPTAGENVLKSADGSITYDTGEAALTDSTANEEMEFDMDNQSLVIAAGTTKTVKYETDTVGCVNPNSIQVNVDGTTNTANGVAWEATDTIDVGNAAWAGLTGEPVTDDLPVQGNAISY